MTISGGNSPEDQKDCEIPTCSLCRNSLPNCGNSVWALDKHTTIDVPVAGSFYVVAATSVGELTICARCYEHLPSYLTVDDQAKIHHEAGLVCCETDEFDLAIECLEKSVSLSRNADVLSTMGFVYGEIGEKDKAIELYEEALCLAPDNFIAKENLRKLRINKRKGDKRGR